MSKRDQQRVQVLVNLEGDRFATRRGVTGSARKAADTSANYLRNKAEFLTYAGALAAGWPIATGAIEGACRHLVKDRMDITGARWSFDSAEPALKLRALLANVDFSDYWRFHCHQERQRNHASRDAANSIPNGR